MLNGRVGSGGGEGSGDEWIGCLDLVKDYRDVYELGCCDIDEDVKRDEDVLKVDKGGKDMCGELEEYRY